MATTPVSFCTCTMRSESARLSAIGISIITCLPARMQSSAWVALHLRRRGEDRGLDARLLQALGEVGGPVRDVPLLGHLLRAVGAAAGERDDLDAVDLGKRLEMLDAERALAGETDLHGRASNVIRPTAVDDAGTLIEAVDFLGVLAERAAHDQPHHQLDRLVPPRRADIRSAGSAPAGRDRASGRPGTRCRRPCSPSRRAAPGSGATCRRCRRSRPSGPRPSSPPPF